MQSVTPKGIRRHRDISRQDSMAQNADRHLSLVSKYKNKKKLCDSVPLWFFKYDS